jgi:hypothetical protein
MYKHHRDHKVHLEEVEELHFLIIIDLVRITVFRTIKIIRTIITTEEDFVVEDTSEDDEVEAEDEEVGIIITISIKTSQITTISTRADQLQVSLMTVCTVRKNTVQTGVKKLQILKNGWKF